jgi:hypothetical protein
MLGGASRRSYALRRESEACTRSRNGIGGHHGMAVAVEAAEGVGAAMRSRRSSAKRVHSAA